MQTPQAKSSPVCVGRTPWPPQRDNKLRQHQEPGAYFYHGLWRECSKRVVFLTGAQQQTPGAYSQVSGVRCSRQRGLR